MKNMRNRGITLIALIITIIILLILAGVTISQLTENGLFGKAKLAKEKWDEAAKEENAFLQDYENKMDGYMSGKGSKFNNVNPEQTNPGAAMPSGAKVIEPDAENGIVIKDSNDNEWVWVEVLKTEEIYTTATSSTEYDKIKTDLETYAKDYRDTKFSDEWYNGCGIENEEKYKELYNKMLKSVYENGGFWISRYEIGDKESTASNTTRTSSTGTNNHTPVSQKDQIPYNYVTESNAQSLASKMSTDASKTSSLLFGIQWDLVCKYLEGKNGLQKDNIKTDSSSWGNYSNAELKITSSNAKQNSTTWTTITDKKTSNRAILLTTGASDDTKKMNIYDLAGNVYEWTLEHATSNLSLPCGLRGGYYLLSGSYYPASSPFGNSPSYSHCSYGFRATLY